MSHFLNSEQLDKSALNLAIEARQLQGIPITFHHQSAKHSWPPTLEKPPTPLEFSRLIARHSPMIIRNCFGESRDPFKFRPRLKEWKRNEYLSKTKGNFKVTVTDDGKADDLKFVETRDGKGQLVFGLPYEAEMSMSSILAGISHPSSSKNPSHVYYLQSQNNNLKSGEAGDFSHLLKDLQPDNKGEARTDLEWASEALGQEPEATNIWIGSERSSSSMHRDHYENLFTVMRGKKRFTVFPPTEAHFLCDDDLYPVYQSEASTRDGSLSSSPSALPLNPGSALSFQPTLAPPIPWIPIDPTEPPDSKRNQCHKRYGKGLAPLEIVVSEGETLFLPAGWFHHVSQESDPLLQKRVEEPPTRKHHIDADRPTDSAGSPSEKDDIEIKTEEMVHEEIGICLSVNWWYESEGGFGDRWAWSGFAREIRRRLENRWGEMGDEREKDQESLDR